MVVTRADVARMAGVSPAVVSYVLNPGSRPVSRAARERVETAVRTLGYRPNAVARALRRSSTMSIGLMVPDLANPAISAVARCIEDIAYDLGYVLFLGTVGTDPAREERYLRTYVDRQVDALILIGSHRPELVTELTRNGLPILVLDRVSEGLGVSTVTPEAFESSSALVKHLIVEHGHHRIACVTGPKRRTGIAADRVAGWRHALDEAGLDSDDSMVFFGEEVTRASGHLGTGHLLDSVRPTAIFTSSDVQAVGVIGAIRERDLLVPMDIAVVSCDASELAERAFPGLTSAGADPMAVARMTMDRLMEKLVPDRAAKSGGASESAASTSPLEETHDVVPTSVTYRRSCGCN